MTRRRDLVSTELDDEVIVYDPESHRVHALGSVAVAVWREWEPDRDVEALRSAVEDALGVSVESSIVRAALSELVAAGLIAGSADGPSRRDVLKTGARVGAVAVATPMLASALVPMPVAAISCGANGSPCSVPNGVGMCQSGVCVVTACISGYVNCDGSNSNGCECAGTGCCTGTSPSSSGTCQVAHSNGYAGTYYDCYPQGTPGNSATYNQQMALDACASFAGPGTCAGGYTCGSGLNTQHSVCKTSTTSCTCWTYSASGTSAATAGHTFSSSSSTCFCPTATDPYWT